MPSWSISRGAPMRRISALTVAGLLLASATPAVAEPASSGPGTTAPTLSAHFSRAVRHDTSVALRDMAPAPLIDRFTKKRRDQGSIPSNPQPYAPDPVVQTDTGPASSAVLGQSFDGLGAGFTGPQGSYVVRWAPPDTAGAVGIAHYVEIVNTDIAIFTKSGAVAYGPAATNTLFQGFGGACETRNDGDGTVEYDTLADRWVISQFALGGPPYYQCVAVSATSDPTGAYHRYAFVYGDFPDYPKLGVWPDAYYTTFNLFSNGFDGTLVCAYERASMLSGAPASQQCVGPGASWGGSLLPADLDGSNPPPAGSPNYLLNLGSSRLNVWRFHVDWADPSSSGLSGPTQIPVASFSPACGGGNCVPQPGTSNRLASLGDRPMYRLAYRNFGDHESLVVNHSVRTGAFGNGPSGVRWYELRDPAGTPTVYQQGTFAPDSVYRWMGSAAMDGAGDLAIGYSVSSDAVKPGLRYAGRLASDPLGTLGQGEGVIVDGEGVQLPDLTRWGDYTALSVDPVDDCTFWHVGQYLKTDGAWNWSTRVASWSYPDCTDPAAPDFSLAVSPASRTITQGGGTTYAVSVSPASGFASPVDLDVEGLPSDATASFAPDPVSGTDGWISTLSVATSATTPTGTYPLTITGSGDGLIRTATASLVVQPPAPASFTLSISPSSRMIRPNGSTTYTVGITRTGGLVEPIDLSVAGLPASYTWSFSQDPVLAATTQVTLSIRASSTKGTFTVTVTGVGGALTRTAQAQLKVNGK